MLYPLEVTSDAGSIRDQMTDVHDNDDQGDKTVSDSGAQVDVRPRCKAAEQAQQQIAECVECIRDPPGGCWRL